MNLHQLIHQRDSLLRHLRLANLAFAYQRLDELAGRTERAGLRGEVAVRPADPAADRFCPELVALEGSQAVLDEHFLDEDVADLADILAFMDEERRAGEFRFKIEDMEARFLPPLRCELAAAGIELPPAPRRTEDSSRGHG